MTDPIVLRSFFAPSRLCVMSSATSILTNVSVSGQSSMSIRLFGMALFVAMSIFASPAAAQVLIGHRGASHDAPENTIAAFKLALEQGADGFEADFYLSSDGRVITLHDKDTERTAGKKLVPKD